MTTPVGVQFAARSPLVGREFQSPFGAEVALAHRDFSDLARLDQFLHASGYGQAARAVAHRQLDPRALRRIHDGSRVLQAVGDGLFAIDVLGPAAASASMCSLWLWLGVVRMTASISIVM